MSVIEIKCFIFYNYFNLILSHIKFFKTFGDFWFFICNVCNSEDSIHGS